MRDLCFDPQFTLDAFVKPTYIESSPATDRQEQERDTCSIAASTVTCTLALARMPAMAIACSLTPSLANYVNTVHKTMRNARSAWIAATNLDILFIQQKRKGEVSERTLVVTIATNQPSVVCDTWV